MDKEITVKTIERYVINRKETFTQSVVQIYGHLSFY